jgi:hypothetical protein
MSSRWEREREIEEAEKEFIRRSIVLELILHARFIHRLENCVRKFCPKRYTPASGYSVEMVGVRV